jgi:hypothetical protein
MAVFMEFFNGRLRSYHDGSNFCYLLGN